MKDFDQSKFTDAPYVVNPIAGVTFLVGAQVPSEEAPEELKKSPSSLRRSEHANWARRVAST
jgi:hypothetical protein